jgi:hypothetical protein
LQTLIPSEAKLIYAVLNVFQAIFESQEHPKITEALREDFQFWNKLQELALMFLTQYKEADQHLYVVRCITCITHICAADSYLDLAKASEKSIAREVGKKPNSYRVFPELHELVTKCIQDLISDTNAVNDTSLEVPPETYKYTASSEDELYDINHIIRWESFSVSIA